MSPFYSVVIPVYNSTLSLRPLAEEVVRVFREQVQAPVEIIMVDDGSPNPDTWPAMLKLAAEMPEVRILQLMRNFGKPGALTCGLTEAKGDYIITMDDDLQHRPEDIPALVAQQEHDVVIGSFRTLEQPGLLKRFSSKLFEYASRLALKKPKDLKLTPFKLFRAEVVQNMLRVQTPYPSILGQMFFVTTDVVNVEVKHGMRNFGESGFTLKKMMQITLNLLISNSSFLLRIVATVGLVISLFSFLLGIYFIIRKLTGYIGVMGWTSLAVISLFTSGLILFSLGIIGEYLIRIINGTEQRPAYIIRQATKSAYDSEPK